MLRQSWACRAGTARELRALLGADFFVFLLIFPALVAGKSRDGEGNKSPGNVQRGALPVPEFARV